MKIRVLTVTLLCAFAALLGLQAQDQKKEPETELGKVMDKIRAANSRLNRQIDDATKNEDSLAQVKIIKEAGAAALKLDPVLKADKPAADQAKFVADYQKDMKAFLVNVDKLEAALKAGNNAEAKNMLATLKQNQKEGHTQYRKQAKKG
jgi:soluble cytochrome b562